jgi:hypothetical protein
MGDFQMGEVLLRHPLIQLYALYVLALILAHLCAAGYHSRGQQGERRPVASPRGSGPSLSGDRFGGPADDSPQSSTAIRRSRRKEDEPPRKRAS